MITVRWCVQAKASSTMRCHHWWLEPMKFILPDERNDTMPCYCTIFSIRSSIIILLWVRLLSTIVLWSSKTNTILKADLHLGSNSRGRGQTLNVKAYSFAYQLSSSKGARFQQGRWMKSCIGIVLVTAVLHDNYDNNHHNTILWESNKELWIH